MFGRDRPPKPPDHEPLLLVVLAVVIAVVLTAGYAGVMYLVERGEAVPFP